MKFHTAHIPSLPRLCDAARVGYDLYYATSAEPPGLLPPLTILSILSILCGFGFRSLSSEFSFWLVASGLPTIWVKGSLLFLLQFLVHHRLHSSVIVTLANHSNPAMNRRTNLRRCSAAKKCRLRPAVHFHDDKVLCAECHDSEHSDSASGAGQCPRQVDLLLS
jgi:hypothetical protein